VKRRLKLLAGVMGVLACLVPGAITVIDRGPQWVNNVSTWWDGPPSNASPLCMQLADMLDDSDRWVIESDDEIRCPSSKVSVKSLNNNIYVSISDNPEADELLTIKEGKYLRRCYDACRQGIIARHRSELAKKLRGVRK